MFKEKKLNYKAMKEDLIKGIFYQYLRKLSNHTKLINPPKIRPKVPLVLILLLKAKHTNVRELNLMKRNYSPSYFLMDFNILK